jgi:hypothetical protein
MDRKIDLLNRAHASVAASVEAASVEEREDGWAVHDDDDVDVDVDEEEEEEDEGEEEGESGEREEQEEDSLEDWDGSSVLDKVCFLNFSSRKPRS